MSEIELKSLLSRLARVNSPLERLRWIGRAWKEIRRMPTGERSRLAKELGIDGADGLIERLASKSGRLPPASLLRALEFVTDSDEANLTEIVSKLGSSTGRQELIHRVMDARTRQPVEPEPEPESHVKAQLEAELKPEPETMTEHVPVPAGKAEPLVDAIARLQPRWVPTPAPIAASVRPPAPGRAPAAPSTARPSPVGIPAETEADRAPPIQRKDQAPADRSVLELVAAVKRERLIGRKLRRVRDHLEHATRLSGAEARLLLGALESEWMRRRVLEAMLTRRLPASFAEARLLVESLNSSAGRRWCISTLRRDWSLTSAQRDELQAVPVNSLPS